MNDQSTPVEPGNVLPAVQQPEPDNTATSPPALPPPTSVSEDDFDGVVPAGQTMPVGSALVSVPDAAADTDLIEKEWVDKAKQIVEHTAEDPFTQQQELSKMKVDYMKKRYNKDVGTV